jgi:hypothetical protein
MGNSCGYERKKGREEVSCLGHLSFLLPLFQMRLKQMTFYGGDVQAMQVEVAEAAIGRSVSR